MILYFSFNLGEKDFSGLPTYSSMFLEKFKNKEAVIINIIADPDENIEQYKQRRYENLYIYDCYLPSFLSSYKPSLENKIIDIVSEFDIDKIIMPDYLLEEYIEAVDNRIGLKKNNIKKVLFVHLLYTGLMHRFLHEPYFDQHILSSMTYLGKNAHIEWRAVITSDIIICNSEFTMNELKKYYDDCNLSQKEIYAIPLGVFKDEIQFSPNLESKRWAYFGRLDSMKGLWYISKDMVLNKELYQENPPIVCGDGMLEMLFMKANFFEKLVDYRGLKNKTELAEVLKDVKYCVFPSIYEPWGLALTEALAMGKICIVSNYETGMLEQVKHLDNAILFDFRNQSIINFINRFNNNEFDIDLKNMSNRANETANDIDVHFDKLRSVLC
jgi:glycosyltransferase involved in cell wall biosynthesis